mgnify:CR=1 FL=1
MSYQEFLSFERRGAVGIVRLARPEKLNTISAPFYEAMIELQQTEIVGNHDLRAIALLAAGGISYTIGGVIYGLKKPDLFRSFGFHELFHCFVLLGSVLHYLVVAIYIL